MNRFPTTLWLLPFDPTLELDESLLCRLKQPQRLRADSLDGKRKIEFTLGRLLLDFAIEHYLQTSSAKPFAATWSISERPDLPPIVSTSDGSLNISISHSKGWLGVVCSAEQSSLKLGIDIEAVRSEFRPGTTDFFCNERQLDIADALDSAESKAAYLTELWTQKEAFAKAHQQSIFGTQIKELDFTYDQGMQLADVGDSHKLSIYCSVPITLDVQLVSMRPPSRLEIIEADDKCPLRWKQPRAGNFELRNR